MLKGEAIGWDLERHSRGQNPCPMEELNPQTPAETSNVKKML